MGHDSQQIFSTNRIVSVTLSIEKGPKVACLLILWKDKPSSKIMFMLILDFIIIIIDWLILFFTAADALTDKIRAFDLFW